MKKLKIAVLPGDGIGNDVTHAAIPIFNKLNIPVEINYGEIGWECWKRNGDPIPQETWDLIHQSDTTLLGAITSKPNSETIKALPTSLQKSPPTYLSPIIQLRQKLDLYANVRPCFNLFSEQRDFKLCIIRENTEGLYAGFDYHPIPQELKSLIDKKQIWHDTPVSDLSCSLRLQSRKGLERLFDFSFSYASSYNFSKITFADKPNVLRKSASFAREIFERISAKYSHIQSEILNVDAVALWLTRSPERFGLIVAENMFGDILSDLAAGVMGGLGFAPSANIGKHASYFEPVHGSAPNVKYDTANPSAMFLTISLLLSHFNYHAEAALINQAVKEVINEGHVVTYDAGGKASTEAVAEAVINRVRRKLK